MADALTVTQAPFVASVSGSAGSAPSVVDLGSYNLTLNLNSQVVGFIFASASSASYFDNVNSFVAVASFSGSSSAQSASSRLSGLHAYAASIALAQQESPAELYLRQLLSQPPQTFRPAEQASPAPPPVKITADKGATLVSGGAVTITNLDLAATAGTAPNTNIVYGVTGGPSRGHLALAYAPGVAISSFTQAQIDQGLLQYVSDGKGAAVDGFTFTVRDGKGQAKAGTFNLTVAPSFAAPRLITNAGATVAEGGATILTTAQLSASDADTADQNLVYHLTGAPQNGRLELTTNPGTAITTFTQADLANGLVRYVHNGSETTSDNFTFTLSDGSNFKANQNFNISVTPVDDAPVVASNNQLTAVEGGTTTITTAQLNTTDVDTSNANLTYTVTGAPTNGYLQLAGDPGVAITSFTQADLTAGNIQYVHNGSETTSDSFTFTVADQTTTLSQQTFNIGITPVDDAPVLTTDSGATVNEGSSVTLTTTNLDATDVDTSNANLTYNVTSGPANGYLQLSSNPGVAVTSFTQADLAVGSVQYVHNGSETASDTFAFSLSDGTTALAPRNFDVTVNPVDDAPVVTTNSAATVLEGGTATLTSSNLNATDPDTSNANLTYTVTGAPAHGYLQFSANPGVAITSFTQADLAAGKVQYVHDGSETSSDSFTFRLSDQTTTLGPASFNISVTPVDDAPVLTTNSGATVNEGSSVMLTTSNLNATDVDTSNANLTYNVTSAPTNGYLQLSSDPGVAVTSFTQADLAAGTVQYVHNGSETTSDAFTFSLSDGTTSLSPSNFNITVRPVDDAPVVTTNAAPSVLEGGTVTLTSAYLNATDPDTSNGNLTYSVTGSPLHGYLQFSNNPGVAITSFTQADLAAGKVQYVHDGSETTSDLFTFRLSDQTTTLAPANFQIAVTPVDDAPVLTTDTGATVHVFGANTALITTAQLSTSDVDTSPGNITYKITGGLGSGYIELTTNPGVAVTSFTQTDIAAGIVEYVHSVKNFSADSFTFTVQDQTTKLAPATFRLNMTV